MGFPSFNVGDVLTASDMNAVGGWLIKSQSFSAQNPFDLTSVFSSSYRNYKIIFDYYGSANSNVNMQFLSGTTTPYTGADYYRYGFYVTSGGVFTGFAAPTQTNMFLANHGTTSTQTSPCEITIFNPNLAQRKYVFLQSFDPISGLFINLQHQLVSNTQMTGLRFIPTSGTITGLVRVYGYKD